MRLAPEGLHAIDADGRTLWMRESASRRVAVAADGSWIALSEKMRAYLLEPNDGSIRFAIDAGFDPAGVEKTKMTKSVPGFALTGFEKRK